MLCCSSETISKHTKNDSIKVGINEIRAANRIFIEHEHLKQILPLIEKENEQLRKNVSRYARIDSIQEIRIELMDDKFRQKTRRLKITLYSVIAASVVLLLVK